jgi:peptidoglycan/LPS O-acetylase OafA/YrhL
MRASKFSVLDGMRGIAALLVVTRHTVIYWGELPFFHSYLAVDLFFILSGFVISHAYGRKLDEGRLSSPGFMLVRWIRLYPLFFLAALLGFVVAVAQPTHLHSPPVWTLSRSLALMLFFLPSRVPGNVGLFPLDGPAWSLFFEMLVNVIFVLTFRRLRGRQLLAFVALGGLALVAVSAHFHGTNRGYTWFAASFVAGLTKSTFGIFLGVLLHRLYERRALVPSRLTVWLERVGPWPSVAVMTLVLLIPRLGALDWVFDVVATMIVLPACVYAAVCARPGPRVTRAFTVLGILSYPVYLLHEPLGALLEPVLAVPLAAHAPLAGVPLIGLLAVLCLALDALYDRPVRRFLTSATMSVVPSGPQGG